MDMGERESFKNACADENQLCKLKSSYRMYKYSKWYKELQAHNKDNLPVTTLLAAIARQNVEENNVHQMH